MRINKPVGSKDRLVEIFQKVNHVKLNENLMEMGGANLNSESVLNLAFDQLKNKKLRVVHSNTQTSGDESYVEIVCTNQQGNNITFTFKATSQEGDQEGVFNVGSVTLNTFSFDDAQGGESVDLDENGLRRFNQQHANEMFNVVQDYLDVEPQGVASAETSSSEELEEAIKLIDAIKKDSSPYGGGFDKMQTGKNYADNKPTNASVRVKSPELDKFIQEFDKPAMKLKMQPVVEEMDKPIAGMTLGGVVESEEKTDYPDPIGKKFKPKVQIKKKKKRFDTNVKLSESSDRDKYEEVVFLQGDEAYQPLEILDREGEDAALEYLKQWHYPGEHQGSQTLGHGSEDKTYEKDGYIMSWNSRLGYIGLQYDMANLNEDTYEDDDISNLPEVPRGWGAKKDAKKDMASAFTKPGVTDPRDEPSEKWAKHPLPYNMHTGLSEEAEPNAQKGIEDIDVPSPGDEEGTVEPPKEYDEPNMDMFANGIPDEMKSQDDGMSMEPESDEIEQLSQDKEEAGELIPGGKADGKTAGEFNPEQILMGLKVEMEHTDDPMYALEIVMDHLTEDPEYYTTKDDPEVSAQANASADAGDDEEMTDVLLGFKPHNVGDEIEGEEEAEESVPTSMEGEPEEKKEVDENEGSELNLDYSKLTDSQLNSLSNLADNGGVSYVKNAATAELTKRKTGQANAQNVNSMNESKQIRIAKETLSNRNVPTGMSKKDAVQLLVKHLIK